MAHVGRNIRAARLAVGHTQESLGAALGITHRAVGQWESGQTVPNRRNLEGLSAVLGHDPAWFYTDHADEPVAA